jgi:DNA-binding HxlR family transcriptional regulator
MVFEAIDWGSDPNYFHARLCLAMAVGSGGRLTEAPRNRVALLVCRRKRKKDGTMPARPDRYCPIARTLAVIGERWTLLILRDLVLDGPRKFQDLEQSLSGISPNTLSARLKTLEESGIVERRFYTDHPPRAEYLITSKGLELRPILRTLKTWGEKHTG